MMRRVCLFVMLMLMLAFSCMAQEQSSKDELRVILETDSGTVEILPARIEQENWLFLPAFAERAQVWLGREQLVVKTDDTNDETQNWELFREEEKIASLRVMKAKHLRAFFLFSDNPVHHGRTYIEDCLDHERVAQGSFAMVDAEGKADHTGRLKQIRGRGNGTWEDDKRPYQIKLVQEANLLDTGNPLEASKTWLLLAEAKDGTLLHNRLALDLALEMGMNETSRSELVDLYYDGEYRGVYLLAEKVEVAPGRIEEIDYSELIEQWNKRIGKKILDLLPEGQAINQFGNTFTYIQGIGEKEAEGAGAFVLEMENPRYTLSDRCWFTMSDGTVLASKNPENASENMMRYISEKLESARRTLQNGGTNPDTGRTSAEEFDLDSFARLALMGEFTFNVDALTYSSTWFVLPAGEDRFKAGPVWDYDLAWRYLTSGKNVNGSGLKSNSGWMQDFYSDPSFMQCIKDIWLQEMSPVIENILLGKQHGKYLKPLSEYAAQIEASARMNDVLWRTSIDKRLVYGENWTEEMKLLEQFIRERWEWMNERFASTWEAETLELTFKAEYGYADTRMHLDPLPWPHVMPVLHCTQLTPATESQYARYRVDAYLSLAEWNDFSDPTPVVNGVPLSYEILPDGRMHFAFEYEDPSYLPVIYDEMDVGWVYNYHQYLNNHPEVVQLVGTEPEKVLHYFFEEGITQNHQGNAYVDAQRILECNPNLWYYFGEEWSSYYWEYIYNGHDEGWLQRLEQSYQPPIEDAGMVSE